jgi:hypothetical protein
MGVRRSGWRLGVGAAVITVALAACSGLPWASDSGASPAASAKALEAARASLQRVARGQAVAVVATGAAFEAATYDQHGHLDFWADTSGSWTRQAARTYPGSTGRGVTVSGALLPGMLDATFVLDSPGLVEDGSVRAVVYARGGSGWGILSRKGSALVPAGRPAASAQALFFGAWLLPGGLRTSVESGTVAEAIAGTVNPIVDYWRWTNRRFVLARNNTLTAAVQPAPKTTVSPLPWGVPSTGTYGGVLQGVVFGPAFPGGVQKAVVLYVLPASLNQACLRANKCLIPHKTGALPVMRFTLDGQAPVEYAATGGGGIVHVSGPAWFLALVDPYPVGNDLDPGNTQYSTWPADPADILGGSPSDYTREGAAPWYIPPRLGLKSFDEIEGYVQLTFKNSKLTHVAVY